MVAVPVLHPKLRRGLSSPIFCQLILADGVFVILDWWVSPLLRSAFACHRGLVRYFRGRGDRAGGSRFIVRVDSKLTTSPVER